MTLRKRIDDAFEAWGRWVAGHGLLGVLLSLLLVTFFAAQIPYLRAENSSEAYLHSDDPASIAYEAFQRRFGQDDRVLAAVETDDIFDLAFLEKLRAFHEDLEASLPHLDEITSLINVRQTRGEGDTLIVEDLLEEWPRSEAELEALRRRVMANPLYVDNVISHSGRLTTLSIEPVVHSSARDDEADALAGFDGDEPGQSSGGVEDPPFLREEEKAELVHAAWEVVARHDSEDFRIHLTGEPVVAVDITKRVSSDSRKCISATALAIAIFLLVLFRRFSGVFYPMLVVVASLVSTMGMMVLLDIPFSIVMAMLPIITMCVGVCNAVHVLVLVYQGLERGESRQQAVASAFRHSGLAIFMTCLTTGAGLASFLTANLATVQDLGEAAPFGVVFAFFYSMTLLPALIGALPMSPRPRVAAASGPGFSQRLLVRIGDLSATRPIAVLTVSALVAIALGTGIRNFGFSQNPMRWFPEDAGVRQASELIDAELRGGSTAEVIVDTGRENGLQDPAVLDAMGAAIARLEALRIEELFIGKATSLIDVVRETHQALNANDPAFYVVPDDRLVIAQELLLFENSGSDDLESLTDSQFREGRVTLRMPSVDAMLYREVLSEIDRAFSEQLGPDVHVSVTGRSALTARTFSAMIESMFRSYAFAIAVITPLMILLIGQVRLGLISMVPNLLPVFLTLAVMGLLGIKLDSSSIVIGSIVIGLAVDDTIHFLHRFQAEHLITGNTRLSVERTLETTGAALLFTSLVLSTGFATVGVLGTMKNTIVFGWITAVGIAIAFIADVVLTPALISLAVRGREKDAEPADDAVLVG